MQKAYACKYCDKQWKTNQSRNGHQTSCKMNPKYQEIHSKISKANKGKCSRPLPEKHQYKIICAKCGREYSVCITQHLFNKCAYNKYCSRSCANSRTHSQQVKQKIGISVQLASQERHKAVCEICGQVYFKSVLTKNRKYCGKCKAHIKQRTWYIKKCIQCGVQFKTHKIAKVLCKKCKAVQSSKKIDWSSINKQAYASGNNYVAGGTTKWIQVETSNGLIKVQGTYEQRMCKVLDKMKQCGSIKDWEYTKDRITYIGVDNQKHSYLLDFKLYNCDQSTRYIQTKGRVQQNDYFKWTATKQKGFNLQICFQKDIKDYELKYNI